MRHIMVLNAKGGCGKSTLATNIAAWYATEGATVGLADYDPQRSSLDWLDRRPDDRPKIHGVAAFEDGLKHAPRNADVLVIDAPARSHGAELTNLVKHAETIIVPVLPSTIDMQATSRFLEELKKVGKVERKQAKIATVANRVRERSPGTEDLEEYLGGLQLPGGRRMPFAAMLRNSQNYVHAAERGLGIFEIAPSRAERDLEMWTQLTRWLNSKRSLPS